MDNSKVDYQHLHSEYTDPTSESYKKLRIVDRIIKRGYSLLDYDISTVDLIDLEKVIMRKRFKKFILKNENIRLLSSEKNSLFWHMPYLSTSYKEWLIV